MAKYKILKAGETDIDSSDIWRFAFHSDHPTWKIGFQGSGTLTLPAGSTYAEYTINHNLGYKPFISPSVKFGAKTYKVYALTFSGQTVAGYHPGWGSGNYEVFFVTQFTDTQLKIGIALDDGYADPDNDVTVTVKWLIKLDEF